MRDTRRIEPTLEALKRYWKRHPDLRLGQIIVNMSQVSDPFYVSDSVLAFNLERADG
jgi:uncharacterized protein YihD (DUF1040 family)